MKKYPTIEIDLDDSLTEYFKQELWEVAEALELDEASMSIFMEAYKDGRDINDTATCLGDAILNSVILGSVIKGMKLLEK